MALNWNMQSPGKVTKFHMQRKRCVVPWWLQAMKNQIRICLASGLPMSRLGVEAPTCFFIIKATCNSCACFGWDTQACTRAIGTRDVSCKWVSRYAFDLERSSLSTSTKTVHSKEHVLSLSLSQADAFGSRMHMSNIYFEEIQLWKRLLSPFDWQQPLVHRVSN